MKLPVGLDSAAIRTASGYNIGSLPMIRWTWLFLQFVPFIALEFHFSPLHTLSMLSKEWNEKIAATVIIYNYKYYYKMYYRIGLERIQTCFSIYSTIHLYPYFYDVRCGYLDGIYEMFFFCDNKRVQDVADHC